MSTAAKSDPDYSFDVIVVGAGVSGINAGYRIQTQGSKGMTYAILEGRGCMGGTWDLFKYPGIRSDSDMFTYGFSWKPWNKNRSIATADEIKDYFADCAKSEGIDKHIRYHHKVNSANWASDMNRWQIDVSVSGEKDPVTFSARFIVMGTGYYDYDTPLQATIPGIEDFGGDVFHPQFWPEGYDLSQKNVVVIGSGATAVTIVPSIADKVNRVTMLQRSPTYILSLPNSTPFSTFLFWFLPKTFASSILRLSWAATSYFLTLYCSTFPGAAKNLVKKQNLQQLPPDIKWDPHFKPRYNPWEQRLCFSLNGDFFAALRSGKADVATGEIKQVTKNTIELASGEVLHPDVIITATGLKLKFAGGIRLSVDGEVIKPNEKYSWRAVMLQDVPNLFFTIGYVNATWTLGSDLSIQLFLRLLRIMEKHDAQMVVPTLSDQSNMPVIPQMKLTSTYFNNIGDVFPKAGTGIWGPKVNYFHDLMTMRWGDATTGLVFQ